MGILCCNPVSRFVLFDDGSPPVPPVELFFYYASVTMSGGFVDDLVAGALGSQGIGQFDGAGLASFLQGLAVENAGAGMDQGDSNYSFWIVTDSATAPVDWTWNDDAITFNDGGSAALKCYDTEEIEFSPDPSAWTQLNLFTLMGIETTQATAPIYSDAGYPAFWASIVTQVGGVGAVGVATVGVATVRLVITNTYLEFQTNQSYDGVGTQENPFNLISCP